MTATDIDDARVTWLAANLLRGVADAALVAELVADGIAPDVASRAIEEVRASPVFAAAAPFVADARRVQMLARRADVLLRSVPAARTIARTTSRPLEDFFLHYVAEGVPAVLTDVVRDWPAFTRWSLDAMTARCGDPEVRVVRKLPRPSGPDVHPYAPTVTLRMSELVRRITEDPRCDLYMVASNDALRGPLAPLVEDITPDPALVRRPSLAREVSLWMGPRGSRTELHHDVMPIIACQVRGRKRWRLVPPTDPVVMEHAVSTLGAHALDAPELEGAFVREVVVEPGEAIFVPVGYWHAVESLDVSITVSLTGLVGSAPQTGFRLDGRL